MNDNLLEFYSSSRSEVHFRTIFIVGPAHDMSQLRKYGDDLKLLTSGFEDPDEFLRVITRNLTENDFDPKMDAIVPVGKVLANVFAGVALSRLFPGKTVTMASYKKGDYVFFQVVV